MGSSLWKDFIMGGETKNEGKKLAIKPDGWLRDLSHISPGLTMHHSKDRPETEQGQCMGQYNRSSNHITMFCAPGEEIYPQVYLHEVAHALDHVYRPVDKDAPTMGGIKMDRLGGSREFASYCVTIPAVMIRYGRYINPPEGGIMGSFRKLAWLLIYQTTLKDIWILFKIFRQILNVDIKKSVRTTANMYEDPFKPPVTKKIE